MNWASVVLFLLFGGIRCSADNPEYPVEVDVDNTKEEVKELPCVNEAMKKVEEALKDSNPISYRGNISTMTVHVLKNIWYNSTAKLLDYAVQYGKLVKENCKNEQDSDIATNIARYTKDKSCKLQDPTVAETLPQPCKSFTEEDFKKQELMMLCIGRKKLIEDGLRQCTSELRASNKVPWDLIKKNIAKANAGYTSLSQIPLCYVPDEADIYKMCPVFKETCGFYYYELGAKLFCPEKTVGSAAVKQQQSMICWVLLLLGVMSRGF